MGGSPLRKIIGFVMGVPGVFDAYQRVIGAPRCHGTFIESYARVARGMSVLDLGCGTGAALRHLPPVSLYLGVDIDRQSIEQARGRWKESPERRFLVAGAEEPLPAPTMFFDRVIAFGLLHHLEDARVLDILASVRAHLRPGGLVATIDPAIRRGDGPLAGFLIRNDRGRHVRDEAGYKGLFEQAGYLVETVQVRTDLLRIPYSQCIIVSRPPA